MFRVFARLRKEGAAISITTSSRIDGDPNTLHRETHRKRALRGFTLLMARRAARETTYKMPFTVNRRGSIIIVIVLQQLAIHSFPLGLCLQYTNARIATEV